MFMFPTPRIGICTVGGGATKAADGPAPPCREETASRLGGGAITEASGRPNRRDVVWLNAGGGATTELKGGAAGSCRLLALELRSLGGSGIGVRSGRPAPAILKLSGRMARPRLGATGIIGVCAKAFRGLGRARIREGLLPRAGKDGGGV